MARYEHLPIYKKAMEMSVTAEETVRHFSRYHKYGIGGDLRDISRQILGLRELEKVREPKFVHDSFASRKGKGTHAAVKRLQRFMGKDTLSMKRPA